MMKPGYFCQKLKASKDKRIGVFALGLATLVGFSRIFVGTHYPGDVLGGAVVGFAASLIIWNLRNKLEPITIFLINIAKKLRLV